MKLSQLNTLQWLPTSWQCWSADVNDHDSILKDRWTRPWVSHMYHFRTSILLLLTMLVTVVGCRSTTEYRLVLRPQGAAMERTIDIPVDREQYEYVATLYDMEPSEDDLAVFEESDETKRNSFTDVFEHTMPNDIGGEGYLIHFSSPFGTTSAYSERFGGYSDLSGMIETRRKVFDRYWSLGLLWLDRELGETDDYESFRRFVDEDLRHDAWNILLLASSTDTIARTMMPDDYGFDEEFGLPVSVRIVHYLIERNYIQGSTLQDSIATFNALDYEQDDNMPQYLQMVCESIARVMSDGSATELPAPLKKLSRYTPDQLKEARAAFYQDDAALQAMIADWNSDPDVTEPYELEENEFMDQLGEQLQGFEIDIFGYSGTVILIDLHLPAQPYAANGVWDDAGVMRWDQQLSSTNPMDADLPNVVYAFWSEPDIEYQTERFGRVLFDDEQLRDHISWRDRLSKKRRREWDTFLAALRLDDDLIPALKSFSFSDETPDASLLNGVVSRMAFSPLVRIKRAVASGPQFCPVAHCIFDESSGWQQLSSTPADLESLLRESEMLAQARIDDGKPAGTMHGWEFKIMWESETVAWFEQDDGTLLACFAPNVAPAAHSVHYIFPMVQRNRSAPTRHSLKELCDSY